MAGAKRLRRPEGAARAGWSLVLEVSIPLLLGGAIYLLARPRGLVMFDWAGALGLDAALGWAREASRPIASRAPSWLLYSGPDALWAYAFAAFMRGLWRDRLHAESAPWLALGPALAIGSELAQAARLVPGTFDWIDLALVTMASVAALARVRRVAVTPVEEAT